MEDSLSGVALAKSERQKTEDRKRRTESGKQQVHPNSTKFFVKLLQIDLRLNILSGLF